MSRSGALPPQKQLSASGQPLLCSEHGLGVEMECLLSSEHPDLGYLAVAMCFRVTYLLLDLGLCSLTMKSRLNLEVKRH